MLTNKPRAALIAAAMAGLTPFPVSAGDWQYARWGMSVAELVEASAGGVRELAEPKGGGRDGPVLAEGRYEAAGLGFDARFHFQEGGLTAVRLIPPAERCGDLQMQLLDLYGERQGATSTRGLYLWHDEAQNTLVHFGNDPRGSAGCVLIYSALRKPGNVGL